MREHAVNCAIESEIPSEFIRYMSNQVTADRIHKTLAKTGLAKETQAEVLDRLIEWIRGEIC